MIDGRSSVVPFEHIVAELAAAPLALPETLRFAGTDLDPDMSSGTAEVWRATEKALLAQGAAYSVDELVSLRDWLWFSDARNGHSSADRTENHLVDYLERLSTNALRPARNGFAPRLPDWTDAADSQTLNDDALARRFWRWMGFALPAELVIAAYPDSDRAGTQLNLMSPVIEKMLLDSGFAEIHMHLGAALEFDILWIATQHSLAGPNATSTMFESPGAGFDEGRCLASYLLAALTGRYVLAAFLRFQAEVRTDQNKSCNFHAFLEQEVWFSKSARNHPDQRCCSENSLHELINRNSTQSSQIYALRTTLNDVATGNFAQIEEPSLFHKLQRNYTYWTGFKRRKKFPDRVELAKQADPVCDFFPGMHSQSSPEVRFLRSAFEYLKSPKGRQDEFFKRLFWQIVRIQVQYYRHIVQRPMVPGLQWFLRHYQRLKPARHVMSRSFLVESAATLCGKDLGLKSLEVRASADVDSIETNRKALNEIYRNVFELNGGQNNNAFQNAGTEPTKSNQYLNQDHQLTPGYRKLRDQSEIAMVDNDVQVNTPVEFGVVFHMSRVAGTDKAKGTPKADAWSSNADPSDRDVFDRNPSSKTSHANMAAASLNAGYRYGAFYRSKLREARSIEQLITRYPRVLNIVRGIDLCTDELAIPNWVLAPILNHLRAVSVAAVQQLGERTGERVEPLRLTAHAGEEFTHLLGGLRRIDEAISNFGFVQGDRIGHAIALGIDASAWAGSTRGVAMTKIDRLFDLAWEARFSTANQLSTKGSRIQFVNSELETIGREIFQNALVENIVARDMIQLCEALYNENYLNQLGFPADQLNGKRARQVNHHNIEHHETRIAKLVQAYLSDGSTFVRGQKKRLIKTTNEAEQLELLQSALRQKISRLGVAIEINPSSNLLIGNLSDLKRHPLWRLKSPFPTDQGEISGANLSVCLGSDDPITFMTNTRLEYQMIYDTLLLSGIGDSRALQWINEARLAGMNSRMTRTVTMPPEEIWKRVVKVDTGHIATPPGY